MFAVVGVDFLSVKSRKTSRRSKTLVCSMLLLPSRDATLSKHWRASLTFSIAAAFSCSLLFAYRVLRSLRCCALVPGLLSRLNSNGRFAGSMTFPAF
jgi:hypothetical protein